MTDVTPENAAALKAELTLLALFDRRRALLPDDRGSGSRAEELTRRSEELAPYSVPGAPSMRSLLIAFDTCGLEKAERARGTTRDTWEVLAAELKIAAELEHELEGMLSELG